MTKWYIYIAKEIIMLLLFVIGTVYCMSKKKSAFNDALDDSKWAIDKDALYNKLRKYMARKDENIAGVIGIKNADNIENVDKKGFAFATDKAYYFVGNVLQMKWIFSWRSNVQHRILANEMKGIKVSNLFPQYALAFLMVLLYGGYSSIKTILKYVKTVNTSNNISENEQMIMDIALFGAVAVIFLGLFLLIYDIAILILRRQTVIDLEFVSQTMRFPINELGKQEIKDFYKAASNVQQIIDNNVSKKPVEHTLQSGNETHTDRISRLKELNELYEKGMLTKAEFDELKKDILG